MSDFRCMESRARAWRSISTLTSIPSEVCKRKLKNLRDRYLKEVRMEMKSKQQGEVTPSRWKYRYLLNVIAPFTGLRNCAAENGNNEDHVTNGPVTTAGETPPSEAVGAQQALKKPPVSQAEPTSQAAFINQRPLVSQDAQLALLTRMPGAQIKTASKPGRKHRIERERVSTPCSSSATVPAKRRPKGNDMFVPNRPHDEDELFLLSFVPALKRLAPQKGCETKLRIQQVMYEAEFNAALPRPQEKPPETQQD
ncbi:uncharacterized protein LOC130121884 [Lampris incognitus]|uniref:uncharacterized protein LOC130121884 n=1 Tax=Lampris incognitus TaxID=2546036 RepID=UPI0024B5719A|nr:uncharacterized protein LOC130121884 [Lampris incognitus]